jgi:hypothetical protein
MVKKKVKNSSSSKHSSKTKKNKSNLKKTLTKTNKKVTKKSTKVNKKHKSTKPNRKVHHIKTNHKPKEKVHHKGILAFIAIAIVLLLAIFLLIKFGGDFIGKAYDPVFINNDDGTIVVNGKGITIFQKDNEKYYVFSADVQVDGKLPLKVGKCQPYDPFCQKDGEKLDANGDDNIDLYYELCHDGLDADGDFDFDCDDLECYAECLPTQEQCTDGEDNDGDIDIDCEDSDCDDYPHCQILNNNLECTTDGDFNFNDQDCESWEPVNFDGLALSEIDFNAIDANEDVMIAVGNGILYCTNAGCTSVLADNYVMNDVLLNDGRIYVVGNRQDQILFVSYPENFDFSSPDPDLVNVIIPAGVGSLNTLTIKDDILLYAVGDNGALWVYDITTGVPTDLSDVDYADVTFTDVIVNPSNGNLYITNENEYMVVYNTGVNNFNDAAQMEVCGLNTNFEFENCMLSDVFNFPNIELDDAGGFYLLGKLNDPPTDKSAVLLHNSNGLNLEFQFYEDIYLNSLYEFTNDLYVTAEQGNIFHYNKQQEIWKSMNTGLDNINSINDITEYGVFLYAVGDSGTVLRHAPFLGGDE